MRHRIPFPHISASDPSALKMRILKSPFEDGSKRMIPSAPIPVRLWHNWAIRLGSRENMLFRLSIRMKSFPQPEYFEKGMFIYAGLKIFVGFDNPIKKTVIQSFGCCHPGVAIDCPFDDFEVFACLIHIELNQLIAG